MTLFIDFHRIFVVFCGLFFSVPCSSCILNLRQFPFRFLCLHRCSIAVAVVSRFRRMDGRSGGWVHGCRLAMSTLGGWSSLVGYLLPAVCHFGHVRGRGRGLDSCARFRFPAAFPTQLNSTPAKAKPTEPAAEDDVAGDNVAQWHCHWTRSRTWTCSLLATATACLVNVCLRLRGMFLVGGGGGVVPPPAPQTSMASSCGEMRIAVGVSGKWQVAWRCRCCADFSFKREDFRYHRLKVDLRKQLLIPVHNSSLSNIKMYSSFK